MSISSLVLQNLANAGVNLTVDGAAGSLVLQNLANTIKEKGTKLTIKNASSVSSLTLANLANTLGSNLTVEE